MLKCSIKALGGIPARSIGTTELVIADYINYNSLLYEFVLEKNIKVVRKAFVDFLMERARDIEHCWGDQFADYFLMPFPPPPVLPPAIHPNIPLPAPPPPPDPQPNPDTHPQPHPEPNP